MEVLRERKSISATDGTDALAHRCRQIAHPLQNSDDLDPLMERIGNARYVLLGEASHGTSEYYLWRMRLTQRLLREKGFSFVAVEGDWPECYQVNRYIKGDAETGANARDVLHAFQGWPTWMWANWEIVALTEWLKQHNAALPEEQRVGFYGLDVYSLWESMQEVIRYVEGIDAGAAEAAKRAYQCFEPFREDTHEYARATLSFVPTLCEEEAVAMLTALRRELPDAQQTSREAHFVAEQNALIVRNAETYYRTMVRGGSASWNVRDRHMVETLERLMRFHGKEAKAIVWEHNTHIGDARATTMAQTGMVNVGQLVREAHRRDDVVLVGFGSHRGSVIAGSEWGAPMERMPMPEARAGSWEDALHRAGAENKLLLMDEAADFAELNEVRGHRAVGVVYEPEYEHLGNYVPTVLPERYDAFLYLDETHALHPLHIEPHAHADPPDTYPWNV